MSPRFVGQFDGLLLIAGLIPLLLVVTIGWAAFDAAQFRESWNVSGEPLYKALPNSLALVFWAFTGLESASVAAAVVNNPERNVPIATIAGVLIAALIYIAASIVIFGLAPAADIASFQCTLRTGGREDDGTGGRPAGGAVRRLEGAGHTRGLGAHDGAGEPRRRRSRPAAADVRAHARGRHAGERGSSSRAC